MSLPPAAPRRHLHTRTITCEGYFREDGLWDIEARIVDQKTYAVEEPYRGHRAAGEHVHDMRLRMTLDATMVVRDIEVATEHAPYDPCFTVASAYKALIGKQVGSGWRKAVNEAVGGAKGCTHLKELLMPAATVAFQTMGSWPRDGRVATEDNPDMTDMSGKKPYFLEGCKAWASDSEVVRRLFPLRYTPRAAARS